MYGSKYKYVCCHILFRKPQIKEDVERLSMMRNQRTDEITNKICRYINCIDVAYGTV
jgi:hypothetical protein